MRRFYGIAVVALVMAGTPRVAKAETSAPGADALLAGVIIGATTVGVLDISFLAYDVVKLSKGERIGTGVAITEIVLTAPQIVAGLYLASKMWNQEQDMCNPTGCYVTPGPNWSGRLGGIGMTLVPTSIVTMAIVDLARSDRPRERSWMPTLAASDSGFFAGVQGRF